MKNKKYPYYSVGEPADLKDLISYCTETYDDKTAFWYKKKGQEIKVSFNQLQSDINALGTYLYSKGYTDTHIAVLGENSYEWIVSYFAIVNGGNVVVPIDKEANSEDVRFQLEKSDASLLIHSDMYSDIAEYCNLESINMKFFDYFLREGKKLLESGENRFINTTIDREKLCAIVFTSGTTAEPKGVMLNHKNLVEDLIVSSKNLCLPGDTVAVLPFYHTYGFMASILCPMLKGYSVFINASLKKAFNDIKYAQPRYIAVVPMVVHTIYEKIWSGIRNQKKENQFKRIIKLSNILLKFKIDVRKKVFREIYETFGGNLEMIITGGAITDEKYIRFFYGIGIKVTNGYGITECSPIVATMRNEHYKPESVGTVNPEIDVRIIDGEIHVKGRNVFMGYYKNVKVTEEVFDGAWFKTGDLGRIDDEGFLYISGRRNNLIILSSGKKIIPEELENLISGSVPEVKEVLVYAENNVITAEIVLDMESDEKKDVIREKIKELNKKLPLYKEISSVKFRENEFPKTTTKKIKRNYGDFKC